jgi:hypothetical protein
VGLFPHRPFIVRLPFALAALGAVALLLFWIHAEDVSLETALLIAIALIGNVSLVLYGRQCRYYALTLLFSMAVVFLYARHRGRWVRIVGLAACALLLLASNYLPYAGLGVALGIDYLVWGRRRDPFRPAQLAALLGSQAVVGGAVLAIWFPLGKKVLPYTPESWLLDRARLFLINLRDLNACELGVGALLLLAPFIPTAKRGGRILQRLCVGIVVAIFVTSIFSPQPGNMAEADVRYIAALIPACIVLGALTIERLPLPRWGRYVVAVLAFQTTLLQWTVASVVQGPLPPLRSTLVSYLGELAHPQPSPYLATGTWLKEHAAPNSTVFVLPDTSAYPLMFHAPDQIYVWQLDESERGRFPALEDHHFRGHGIPDYLVGFGPYAEPIRELIAGLQQQGATYERVALLDTFWADTSRPEVFWHSFDAIPYDAERGGIHIFRRKR